MNLEEKYPKWYMFLHFCGNFLGPVLIASIGIFLTTQAINIEDMNANLVNVMNTNSQTASTESEIQKEAKKILSATEENKTDEVITMIKENPLAAKALKRLQEKNVKIPEEAGQQLNKLPIDIVSRYSVKIWYPKGNRELRRASFAIKKNLIKAGYDNSVSVYSKGGVFFNRHAPPEITTISIKEMKSDSKKEIKDAFKDLLKFPLDESTKKFSDFDVLIDVGKDRI